MKKVFIECCLESLNEAINAEKRGANQIELCRSLSDDGLTPDYKLARRVIDSVSVPVKIMVRPRKGNFIYSDEEMDQIKYQIRTFKSIGVTRIVFGALNKHRTVDINHTKRAFIWTAKACVKRAKRTFVRAVRPRMPASSSIFAYIWQQVPC